MFGYRTAQGDDRTVIASPAKAFEPTAVRFVRHPDRTVERRVSVPVPRIKKIEHIANEIIPVIRVEGFSVRATVDVEPLIGDGLRDVRIDRQGSRRKEKLRRLAVMIDGNLRVPLYEGLLQIACFFLRHRERVAV